MERPADKPFRTRVEDSVPEQRHTAPPEVEDGSWPHLDADAEQIDAMYRQALDGMQFVETEAQLATASEDTVVESTVDATVEPATSRSENSESVEEVKSTPKTTGFDRLEETYARNRVSPEKILEAALFVGGTQLTAKNLRRLLGGNYPADFVEQTVDEVNLQYAQERRPYEIHFGEGGYRLELKSEFDRVRNRVFGIGPKEIRLSQDSLETLSLVAYRQPITSAEIENLRGQPAAGTLRQLIRRELVALERDPENRKNIKYRTTPRFLQLFGLSRIDELPQPDDLSFK